MRLHTCFCLILSLCSLAVVSCQHGDREKLEQKTFDALEEDRQYAEKVEFMKLDPGLSQLKQDWLKPNTAPYRLGVGDQIQIEILEISGSLSTTFVMPDGRVYFDLAGGVKADGLTVKELGDQLTEKLSNAYAAPKVNVTLQEVRSRRVWVLGRVGRPGLYPLLQPTTILEAIAMAGGLFTSRFSGTTEELADLGSSFILRKGEVLPVDFLALLKKGDMRQNIYLRDGDYIYLPSALSQSVNVLGAVRLPQAVGFKDEISLIAAIGRAKGPLPSAQLHNVKIIRGGISDPRVATVNVSDIMAGKAPNLQLRSHDIVWIPERPTEKLRDYFWIIMNAAASSVAIREGANSVENGAGPTPVIPIGTSR